MKVFKAIKFLAGLFIIIAGFAVALEYGGVDYADIDACGDNCRQFSAPQG